MTSYSGSPEPSEADLNWAATGMARLGALLKAVPVIGQLSKYTVASVVALATDLMIYLALAKSGTALTIAAIVGYSIGMMMHFVLSSRYVFETGAIEKSEPRLFGEFAVSGAVGLVLTVTVVFIAEKVFLATPFIAKLAAVAISFLAVYFVRRCLVFRD